MLMDNTAIGHRQAEQTYKASTVLAVKQDKQVNEYSLNELFF